MKGVHHTVGGGLIQSGCSMDMKLWNTPRFVVEERGVEGIRAGDKSQVTAERGVEISCAPQVLALPEKLR